MRTLLIIFLIVPVFLFAQKKKLRPVYGFALNNGFESVHPEDRNLEVQKNNVIGYYVSLGFNFNLDSTYLFYAGVRTGRESSRFMIPYGPANFQYRTRNTPLSFLLAPGIKLNTHNSLFLTLNIVRVLQSNHGGGGGGSRAKKEYYFTFVDNLPQNSWEFRPGLKWQIKPYSEKKFAFEFGIEPSFLTRKIRMIVSNPNPNLPSAEYRMKYELVMLYAGFQF